MFGWYTLTATFEYLLGVRKAQLVHRLSPSRLLKSLASLLVHHWDKSVIKLAHESSINDGRSMLTASLFLRPQTLHDSPRP